MNSSIADMVAPQLPYLRRFARGLTGSQERGDAYVVATLEAIITDNRIFRSDLPPKVALYHVFLNVWNAIPFNQERQPRQRVPAHTRTGAQADPRIESLAPKSRQAFLLTVLEEFSTADIALVLGVTEAEVKTLIGRAGKEISKQAPQRFSVFEDEQPIALDIEARVGQRP